MRVLIDTTYAVRAPYSGTAVYLERLQESLRRFERIEVLAVSNERRKAPAGGGIGSVGNLLVDWRWTALELPRLARHKRADVIHHPLPARALIGAPVQVITVHDLAFERLPQQFDRKFRLFAHHAHRSAARAANAVICVSRTTASDVQALWGVPPERIVIAPHGPGQEPAAQESSAAAAAQADFQRAPQYFLYVGDDEPRKNLNTLLAAYGRYRDGASRPLELVLAGSAARNGPGVRVEQRPDRERLTQLYAGAAALVHPSLYEGFGLTALEAMSAGTPVLAADVPGVREVCAGCARYVKADDADSFAKAMSDVAQDPALRRDLGAQGLRRAAEFSWEHSARAHLDAYSLALRRT